MLDATATEMVILIKVRMENIRFIAFMSAISRETVLEKIYLFRRLLKYWNGSRCCGFWRWPRREAQRRYPQRSRPSEQRRPAPKSTQPLPARGRRAAGGVARSLQPAAGMRLPRSLPSALLPLRATRPSISTVSEGSQMKIYPTLLTNTWLIAIISLCLVAPPTRLKAQTTSDYAGEDRATSYILAPNDLVDIKVFQEDDLEAKLRISKDGTITFPLIGQVHVGGRTPQEAAR